MKKCCKCKRELSDDSFARNRAKKSGLNSACRDCQKEYKDQHYHGNKQSYIERNAARRVKLREWFRQVKAAAGPCTVCAESEVCCLDFHHLDPNEKDGAVFQVLEQTGSKRRVLEEIAKCVVLCANCHRKYHAGIITLAC